jgi:toxin ParE1/3/4
VKLRYSRRARRQLDNIHTYLQERDSVAATRVVARIQRSISLLLDFPRLAPHGLVAGTRELVVVGLPYIVVYRLANDDETVIEILGVYHSAQDRIRDFT